MTDPGLRLEPLQVAHATELAVLLDDPALHTFIGGAPATEVELRARYARQVVGHSADGRQQWCNWVVRQADGRAVGTVQATVVDGDDGTRTAELAWVVATAFQGRGVARRAGRLMVQRLLEQGVGTFVAHVRPDHAASAAVARGLGLRPTDVVVDGEVRWESADPVS